MLLFYMDGLSLEDVARVLHVPLGTAQSRLHYGRRKLKDMLRRKGYGNDRR
jgi:RNA polymerase sigma-70 factor (ECF subfamily)